MSGNFKIQKYILPSLGRGTGVGLLCLLMLLGCRREQDDHLVIRQAAERYYGYLAKGDVDKYMKGLYDYDSLPDDYRSQLRDMFLQYLDREQHVRQGILSATALRDTIIDERQAHVFLEVLFGDSTREQVSLPLVLTDDGWRMK